jgi:ubiquinol-cytochrome c reductase iron-sulfur subunit
MDDLRNARTLPPEKQDVAGIEPKLAMHLIGFSRQQHDAFIALSLKRGPRRMPQKMNALQIVQSRALQAAVRQGKAARFDDIDRNAKARPHAQYGAGIGRNVGLEKRKTHENPYDLETPSRQLRASVARVMCRLANLCGIVPHDRGRLDPYFTARNQSLLEPAYASSRGGPKRAKLILHVSLTGVFALAHGHDEANVTRRDFIYVAATGMTAVGGAAAVVPFVDQMNPAKDTLALATTEVDVSAIEPGQSVTKMWRKKPVFIRRRTAEEIKAAQDVPVDTLPDPESDGVRVQSGKEEWLIVLANCTHLGCVPDKGNKGEFGGWLCPCHGSHYDTSGRIRKGPAPKNLAVPDYRFASDTLIVIGEAPAASAAKSEGA